jgi:hypothetical protein
MPATGGKGVQSDGAKNSGGGGRQLLYSNNIQVSIEDGYSRVES